LTGNSPALACTTCAAASAPAAPPAPRPPPERSYWADGQPARIHQDQPRPEAGRRTRERWPQLADLDIRFRGKFAYVTGQLPDGTSLPLCRLRYAGYASTWGFAIYRASHDDYQDSTLPNGQFAGTPEEALDCACGLYLADPAAWLTSPDADTSTNLRAGPLASQSVA
jgi:hypothetical protein